MIASGLCLRSDHRYQKDWFHVNWNKRHYDNESKQRTLDFGEKGPGFDLVLYLIYDYIL